MPNALSVNWWTGLLVVCAIALLIVSLIMQLREWGFHPLREITRLVHRPWFEVVFLVFFAGGMVQYGSTKENRSGGRSTESEARVDAATETEMTALRSGNSQETGEVTNLCFTGIAVLTNGIVLNIAWPTNLFVLGTTLDFFAKCNSLTNAWHWFACCSTSFGMTNTTVVADWQDDLGCTSNPPSVFFKVQDRTTCANTMSDTDCDGLPDVYELHNGTNPYVSDYALAPKLTVGEDGDYATLVAALSSSTNYSIVELPSGVEALDHAVALPAYPILLTGPPNGYARLYSSANIAAFLVDGGQDNATVFRNLYVVLTARSNFQSAFWIGGNLPWSGVGASPVFENVRVRALYPNVLHYGWHYYRDNNDSSSLSNCVMNAAGSTSAIGLYSYGGPNVFTSACAFVNVPTNDASCAIWMKSGTNIVATLSSTNTNLSWAGYALDQSYSSTADSDGDGLSDYAEIRIHDTDPWLPDSDGDGLTDAEELDTGTDPKNLFSFYRHVTVVTTATDDLSNTTNYVAWGMSSVGWETNGMSCCWTFPTTNVYDVISSEPVYVKSYRDLNRNGQYDPETDIILIRQVPQLDAISSLTFQFGDVDGDDISDATERQHGVDPYNKFNKCFTMALTMDGVPHTTNALMAKVSFEGAEIWGPSAVTSTVLSVDLGHIISTNGESVVLTFWDDTDGNSSASTNEWSATMSFSPNGHDNAIDQWFYKCSPDRDNDGVPDYWETLHADAGLSPTNAADALLDPDGDGLINLHEFWADCEPNLCDGTNTAFYAATHSIDDRISNLTASVAWPIYNDFKDNIRTNVPPIVEENTNCWAHSLFSSRFSLWCSDARSWHEYFMHELNLVSPQHAITATHCNENTNATYMFRGLSGKWYARAILNKQSIQDTDITVCLLNEPVPTNDVRVTPMLPIDYNRYLGTLLGIPVAFVDQDKNAVVQEIIQAPQSIAQRNVPLICGRGHTASRSSFYQQAVGYDSGSPCYMLLDAQPVFLYAIHARSSAHEGAGVAENATLYSDEIQSLMDNQSDSFGFSRYAIQRVDLSRFKPCQND